MGHKNSQAHVSGGELTPTGRERGRRFDFFGIGEVDDNKGDSIKKGSPKKKKILKPRENTANG